MIEYHTQNICMGTGSDVLEVTEDNIVFEHKHRHLSIFKWKRH